MGKSTINGPFSIAMLNYQRVHDFNNIDPLHHCHHIWNGGCPLFRKGVHRVTEQGEFPGHRGGISSGPKAGFSNGVQWISWEMHRKIHDK